LFARERLSKITPSLNWANCSPFFEISSQKRRSAQGATQRDAGYKVRLGIHNSAYKYLIPNTQNCYSFIGIISYPEAEPGLVIKVYSPRLRTATARSA
jgi:hypothetical protein